MEESTLNEKVDEASNRHKGYCLTVECAIHCLNFSSRLL